MGVPKGISRQAKEGDSAHHITLKVGERKISHVYKLCRTNVAVYVSVHSSRIPGECF
jgi:hypothetical protein